VYFVASDWKVGIAIIRGELEGIGLLNSAQIGWFDSAEQIWRYAWPAGSPGRFEDNLELSRQWAAAAIAKLKQ
jgi:hypothetical protein